MSEQIKRSDVSEKDIFGFIIESARIAEKEVKQMNDALRESAKLNSETLKKNSKLSNATEIKETENAIKLANFQMKEKLKLENDLVKIEAQRITAEKSLREATDKNTDSLDKQNKKLEYSNSAYKKLSDSARDLKNKSKTLGAELLHLEQSGKKNTREFAEMSRQYKSTTAQALVLDSQLKKLDSRVGDNFRSVGNYQKAIGGLKNMMMQLGLGLGIGSAIKSGITTVAEFENAVADLSAITGKSGNDLKFLEEKAISFSKEFGTSAKNIAEAFKLAGSARPELLKNSDALIEVTRNAILLSKASGDDVPTSIKNLTGTLNAFNIPANKSAEVMDILANASLKGAQEIPYLTDAFAKFGGVAANAGINVSDSASAIELLGEKIPDATTAGTQFRNIILELQTGAAAQGREFKGLAGELELLKPKLHDVTFLEKTFHKENILGAQILISQVDRLKEFSSELGKVGTTQEQANIKSKTLSEAWNRLKANTEALFLEFRGGSGYVTTFLDFISKNLPNIISLVTKLGLAFVTFKTIMKTIDLAGQFSNWRKLRGAIGDTATATNEAKNSAQGFGNALKSIGWTALIGFAFELGKEVWNIASGAKQAEENLNRLNKQSGIGNKRASERSSKRQLELQQNIDLAKSEKEKLSLQNANTKAVNDDIKSVEERQEKTKKDIAILSEYIEKNKGVANSVKEFSDALNESLDGVFGIKAGDNVKDVLAQRKADLESQNVALRIYKEELNGSAHSEKILTKEIKEGTKELEKNTEAVYKSKLSYEDFRNAQLDLSTVEYTPPEITFFDIEEAEEAIKLRNEAFQNERRVKAEIHVLNAELFGSEKELREARINQILENKDVELENLELTVAERERIELQAQKDIADIEREGQMARFKTIKEFVDFTADYFIKRSEEKIAQIDKEIEASEKQSDILEQLAINGNITAQQSLAVQQQITNKANLEKIKEQKTIERIKLAETVFDTYSGKVESGDKTPLLSTIKDITLLDQFIASLPAFEDGTDNAPKGWALTQEKGAEIITDKDGNIKSLGSKKGAELTYLDSGDKVYNANETEAFNKYKNGSLVSLKKIDSAGTTFDLLPLMNEVKAMKQAIIDKPVSNVELGRITQNVMEIIETKIQGNLIKKTHFNIRK